MNNIILGNELCVGDKQLVLIAPVVYHVSETGIKIHAKYGYRGIDCKKVIDSILDDPKKLK